jgi:hypothetical protein
VEDTNGDGFVQRDELDLNTVLTRSAAFDPANPTNFSSPGRVDSGVKNDRTREFIAGFQHELMPSLGVELNYIWRKYDRFRWSPRDGMTSANFTERTCHPRATAAARSATTPRTSRCRRRSRTRTPPTVTATTTGSSS